MKLVEVSPSNCSGCRCCEVVCSLRHERECSTTKSRIKILRDEEFGNNVVSLCMQCPEAYCLDNCPTEALRRDEGTGAMLVNSELCTGCEVCIGACPLGAISLDREKNIVFVCDLCEGDPECAKICNREVLLVKEVELGSPIRKSFIEETSNLLVKMRDRSESSG